MTTLSADTTVGQIAASFPASVRVFERYGIDFCCGGTVGLEPACRQQGLDPAAVLNEIESAAVTPADATDWAAAPVTGLVDHIVDQHHEYLKRQLPRIGAMLAKVRAAHGASHGEMLDELAAVYGPFKEELEGHMWKEENILFPMIRQIAAGGPQNFHCGGIANPIRVMLMEHDSAGDALKTMRQITGGYTAPEDACNTFRALYFELDSVERDLHLHIHKENNILFPRVV